MRFCENLWRRMGADEMKNNKNAFVALLCLLGGMLFSTAVGATETGSVTSPFDNLFGLVNGVLARVLFFDVMPGEATFPFIVAWLLVGAVYFTFRMGFVNLHMFRHAYRILRGHYQVPGIQGEVSSFQALTAALSATVGLGNIAGVAIAVSYGGPGATFWMIVAGLLGMTTKFTEATLAQTYREIRPDGRVMGGAMEYLSRGLAEKGWARTGRGLAILFCVLAIGASLGGGNAFQVSQSLAAVKQQVTLFAELPWLYGVIMGLLVGVVIIGGIRRIARTAEAIVPLMVAVYLLACIWIILAHAAEVPGILALIVTEAFSLEAGIGGLMGVIVQGFQRAAFSSEAGLGSAAIAHATARVAYPVRQGIVALMEPFIDTVVICTMTALVIVITGVYADAQYVELVKAKEGAALTSMAFGSVISWFPILLSISVVLFAYSTMIAWSYYGERCWAFLFGERSSIAYRLIFVLFIVIGSVTSATNILDFSDLMLLSMAFPNLIALYVLQDKVRDALREYLVRLRSGELDQEVERARERRQS
jgi:AGCS family alanine or glycine:cation symporter